MKNISLELYRTFWAVGKTLNMTNAAKLLYVSQPSVSLALKSLEEQLGVLLCIRGQKGVILTAEGQALFEELDFAFARIEIGERKLQSLLNLDSGNVSISASDTVCNYYLMPFITSFCEKHPEIHIEITNRTSFETLELVQQRKVELGFVNLPINDKDLKVSKCMDLNNVLIAGIKYSYLRDKPLNLNELEDLPMIMLERKSNSRLHMDKYFDELGIHPVPILELGSIDLIINFVKNNHGLAFVPLELCGHLIDNTSLFQIKIKPAIPQNELAMIELKNIPISHAAYHFKKFILASVKSHT